MPSSSPSPKSGPDPSREQKAARIAANPGAYKVCEGCDSIVGAGAALCPNCHSFRFDITAARVVKQALFLGGREQSSVTAEDIS
jgi:hypothetical protein